MHPPKKQTSHNRKQRLPKACKEVIMRNANLVLKQQVTLIELKWDDVRKQMTYLACSSRTGKIKEPLSDNWLYEKFATTKPGFYTQLMDVNNKGEKIGSTCWFGVLFDGNMSNTTSKKSSHCIPTKSTPHLHFFFHSQCTAQLWYDRIC